MDSFSLCPWLKIGFLMKDVKDVGYVIVSVLIVSSLLHAHGR